MTVAQEEHVQHLRGLAWSARKFADWIYHDVRLDCDDMAGMRTLQRLHLIHEQFGKDALFGITAWWAMSGYWRLTKAHEETDRVRPELLPKHVMAVVEAEDDPARKKAVISSQQFISTMTHDNVEMAEAIFNAAYDSSEDDTRHLMESVLQFTLNISAKAESMKWE